jgi:hypothetical protein
MSDDQTPAEEAAVRARLAEARHTGPIPSDVASRLDAVLAELTAARHEQDAPAPVVPLPTAAARRRRVIASGLVAAAAVVALGVALPQLVDGGGSGDAGSASSADRSTDLTETAPKDSADSDGSAGAGSAQLSEAPESGSAFDAPLALSSGEPLRPVLRALVGRGAVPMYAPSPRCRIDVGEGERVDATWDGLPALVVLRAARDGRRQVDVYLCSSADVVGSTSLRAP